MDHTITLNDYELALIELALRDRRKKSYKDLGIDQRNSIEDVLQRLGEV